MATWPKKRRSAAACSGSARPAVAPIAARQPAGLATRSSFTAATAASSSLMSPLTSTVRLIEQCSCKLVAVTTVDCSDVHCSCDNAVALTKSAAGSGR